MLGKGPQSMRSGQGVLQLLLHSLARTDALCTLSVVAIHPLDMLLVYFLASTSCI